MARPPPGRARSRAASRSAWACAASTAGRSTAQPRRACWMSGGDPADEARAAAAARALAPRDLERDGLRDRRIERAASELAAHPACARRAAGLPAGLRRHAAGRRDRRPRHRHGRLPRGGREALRHGEPRGAGAQAAGRAPRPRRRRGPRRGRGRDRPNATGATRSAPCSPLRRAADAVPLDTTALDADETFRAALDIVRERRGFALP